MTARASVVIACRNAANLLPETLEAVVAQGWREPWEIILADNGSTDDSLAIFRAVAARTPGVPMRSVDASARPGKSFALNRGIAAAEGRSILVCDADDVPAPGWLAAMGTALETHDFVSARVELRRLNASPYGIYRPVAESTWVLGFAPFALCTAGATMGFNRGVFDALGGFSEEVQPEDDEFCIRAHLAGYRLVTVPEAVVHYRMRTDLRSIYAQAFQYSRTHVQNAKRYRPLGPRPARPWRIIGREVYDVARGYAKQRLKPRGPEVEAKLRWRMGWLAGQFAGVVRFFTPPTMG
jgi:cellulose synthase/poly-beta-1,6-N-acetylglucosamine synthase-like glycosyltransferase